MPMLILRRGPWVGTLALLACLGCAPELDLTPREPRVFVVYDPGEGEIPMPSDLVRDVEAGRLDLPIEGDHPAAEVAFRTFLNGRDGWSTTFPGRVSFSAPIAPGTVTAETLQIWSWASPPQRLDWVFEDAIPRWFTGPVVAWNDEHTELTIDAPRDGWRPGHRYAMVLRAGIVAADGTVVGHDAAFHYLRSLEPLDDPAHQRAFPGDTREERLDNARTLERTRADLAPIFDHFAWELPAAERFTREEVLALWAFTVTEANELAMDRASQRVPIPFDLLIDPETGLVDLTPEPAHDTDLVADAKAVANRFDGFGVSAYPIFEMARGIEPESASPDTIELWALTTPPTRVPIERIDVLTEDGPCERAGDKHPCKYIAVVVEDRALPLALSQTHAVVVREGLESADGAEIAPMLIGHFMVTPDPIAVDGASQVDALPDDLARRLEGTRRRLAPLFDTIGREGIVTAWPFTTFDPWGDLSAELDRPRAAGVSPDAMIDEVLTLDALNRGRAYEELFPGVLGASIRAVYAFRAIGVERVVRGTIASPYYLGRGDRRWREDDTWEVERVRFELTLPADVEPDEPVPVVIFGHGVVTDRRFGAMIAGELAQRGMATISIDMPFHGERVACIDASLAAIPNFFPQVVQDLTGFDDQLIYLPPCQSGDAASCGPSGECVDANGDPEPFNNFLSLAGQPAVMDMKPASGAAFLDVEDIPHIPDHFRQALVDLAALKRSLLEGDWSQLGLRFDPQRIRYAGQSLGGIIGAVYVALDPDIERAVLNVPGADLVDLFRESTFFAPQVDAFFERHQIPDGSWEQVRLLNVARWLIDSIDPHTLGPYLTHRQVLLQMARSDIVIPNRTTDTLQRVSALPRRTFLSPLHLDLVVPGLGDAPLRQLARFLEEGIIDDAGQEDP